MVVCNLLDFFAAQNWQQTIQWNKWTIHYYSKVCLKTLWNLFSLALKFIGFRYHIGPINNDHLEFWFVHNSSCSKYAVESSTAKIIAKPVVDIILIGKLFCWLELFFVCSMIDNSFPKIKYFFLDFWQKALTDVRRRKIRAWKMTREREREIKHLVFKRFFEMVTWPPLPVRF